MIETPSECIEKLFGLGVRTAGQTSEPSVRNIIRSYYRAHFDPQMAENLTKQLITKLGEEFAHG